MTNEITLATSKRIHLIARRLYLCMPGAPEVPIMATADDCDFPLWGEVEDNEHYAFCKAIAEQIAEFDARKHVEAD